MVREVRLSVPDARSAEVRRRVALAVAGLNAESERDALGWIEAVGEFDCEDSQSGISGRSAATS
jgi:hypothetical protein